jgi:hypothetical protein
VESTWSGLGGKGSWARLSGDFGLVMLGVDAMRSRWTAVLLLIVAGCSDPAIVVLTAGKAVKLKPDPQDTAIPIMVPATGEFGPTMKDVWVPLETRVEVVEDKEAEPPISPQRRLVRVRVVGGEHDGLEGQVSRRHLRP